jgi:uncharacterized protein (TIGR02246 family)
MRHVLAIVIALASGTAAESRAMQCVPISDATINSQFDRFNQAWATKSPEKVTALFAPGAVLLPTLSDQERTTTAAIRDYFVGFLKQSPVGHIDTSSIRLGCNMAARMGNWSVKLTDPLTHKTSVAHARYTFIYTYERGQWMIAHLHSSLMPHGH